MVRASVVLPEPDWPTRATISLSATSRSTPRTARTRLPARSVKSTETPLAASSADPVAALPVKRNSGSPTVGKALASARLCSCLGAVMTCWDGPSSTSLPPYITASRAQLADSTDRSWLIIISAISRSVTSRPISSRIWACTTTSSAVVGSSAITSRGSHASAIAIITRCFWPPESSCG